MDPTDVYIEKSGIGVVGAGPFESCDESPLLDRQTCPN